MATWRELSVDNLRAAKMLFAEGLFRPAITRAYYAAYCAATGELESRALTYAHNFNNPPHNDLPELIIRNTTLPQTVKWSINRWLRSLRDKRQTAEYRPRQTIGEQDARVALAEATDVLQELGINEYKEEKDVSTKERGGGRRKGAGGNRP